ncbi:MAG: hypothetical protein ACOC0D_10220, partial [Spirochaeta sp.]
MKKKINSVAVGVALVLLVMSSCASEFGSPNQLGEYIPANAESDEMVTLTISGYISVTSVNGEEVDWRKNARHIARSVHLPAGHYRFVVSYSDGRGFTYPSAIHAQLMPGSQYRLGADKKTFGKSITYYVVETSNNTNVIIEPEEYNEAHGSKQDENAMAVIGSYIENVLNHTMDEIGDTVILENE